MPGPGQSSAPKPDMSTPSYRLAFAQMIIEQQTPKYWTETTLILICVTNYERTWRMWQMQNIAGNSNDQGFSSLPAFECLIHIYLTRGTWKHTKCGCMKWHNASRTWLDQDFKPLNCCILREGDLLIALPRETQLDTLSHTKNKCRVCGENCVGIGQRLSGSDEDGVSAFFHSYSIYEWK